MTTISAYMIGAAALGVTAAWIVGLKAEPASAPIGAATMYRGTRRPCRPSRTQSLYLGGNACARLVLSQRGCKF